MVESSEPYTNLRMKAAWQEVLQKNRYLFAYFDGINDFWVRRESAHLLGEFLVPVNVLDFYKIYDPELESLRSQCAGRFAALSTSIGHDAARNKSALVQMCSAVALSAVHAVRRLAALVLRRLTGRA